MEMIEEVGRNILCFIKNYNGSFDINIHSSSNNWIDDVAIRAKNQLCIICHVTCGIICTSWKMKITLSQILKSSVRRDRNIFQKIRTEKPLTTCPTLTRSSISWTSWHPPFWSEGWDLTLCIFLIAMSNFLRLYIYPKTDSEIMDNHTKSPQTDVEQRNNLLKFRASFPMILQKKLAVKFP